MLGGASFCLFSNVLNTQIVLHICIQHINRERERKESHQYRTSNYSLILTLAEVVIELGVCNFCNVCDVSPNNNRSETKPLGLRLMH